MDLKKIIGKNVKEARKSIGLSQLDFSNKIGLSRTSVANIERGIHCTTVDNLMRICKITGVSINDLFNMDSDNKTIKPDYILNIDISVLKFMNKLSENKQKALMKFIDTYYD